MPRPRSPARPTSWRPRRRKRPPSGRLPTPTTTDSPAPAEARATVHMRAEQLTGPEAHHAEGPVWSDRWGGLRWVDMLAGDVLSLADDGTVGRRHVGDVAAALRPRRGGGAVIAVERGFALEDPDGTVTALDPVWTDPLVRMNEGGCDPDGRFWCGSMAYDKRPGGATLYRL